MRAGRVLSSRAAVRRDVRTALAVAAALEASRVDDTTWAKNVRALGGSLSPTHGSASTDRAWQPTYDPEHRPMVGFTPNPEGAPRGR